MREISMLDLATFLSALGCGLVAGFFFAFSAVVMKALGKLPPAQGIAAMQSINVVVINPWFLTAFFGTAAACVLVMVASLLQWHDRRTPYLLAGGVLYLVGTIVVTMVFNVPRNNVLAGVEPASDQGARVWAGYLTGWTAWNHVRTVAALVAAAAFARALRLQ
ncbi:MAG: DUF1772 domain-containing protein [Steroidobacteraceae bacterium]